MILFSNSQRYQVFLLHYSSSLFLSSYHPCHPDCCALMHLYRGVVDALRLRRAFPHSQAQSAGFGATAQRLHLALSGPSISRKCHESVMSSNMGNGPKPLPTTERERAQAGTTADLGPHQISSAFPRFGLRKSSLCLRQT